MAKATTEPSPLQKLVLDAIAATPDAPTRTLARALHHAHPKVFLTIERARDHVRKLRGNHGEKNRIGHTDRGVRRPNGTAGWKPSMPKAHVETWEPFELDGSKRILSLSDIHVPYHDEAALRLAIKTGKDRKADCVLINGDLVDFYQISRFVKDPTRRDAVAEVRDAAEFLLYLRQEFPRARLVFKTGNHDERWDHWLWDAAPVLWKLEHVRLPSIMGNVMRSLCDGETAELADYGWEFISDQRPIMAGKLPILHGHELPKGMSSPVNPARGAYMRTAHTILIGHGHRSSHHVEPDMFGREVACWSQGCLCGMRPAYAKINKWNQGFAMVDVGAAGEFELTNFRIADGKVRAS